MLEEVRLLRLSSESMPLNFFSVRNYNDKSYVKGEEIENGIYDINDDI